MKMDLGSALMGAIAIIICVLLYILLNRNKKKREKLFLQPLLKMAAQNNCQIHKHEIFGNFAIGMDETKNFVFFHKLANDEVIEQSVDLGEIQSCKVINTSRMLKSRDGGSQKVIDRLQLSFIPLTKTKPGIKMEFFNSEVSIRLNGELQLIEKWSKLINDHLNHMK